MVKKYHERVKAALTESSTASNPKGRKHRVTRAKAKSTTLLPAKVRVNPRTGKVQVFVTPGVMAKVKSKVFIH
jgi:hypothetical protein